MKNLNELASKPTELIDIKKTFGFESDIKIKGFKEKNDWVPKIDNNYVFDKDTTLAILAGFAHNRSCLLYTSPSPRDLSTSRMPSSA